ncbi:MAG: cysteine--tRNA ligase [Vulcanimicrobiaceae bacterium]
MSLRLYNTRTRTLQEFKALNPPTVRIYVCGMTPSAESHLGHARSFLFFDVLRRYLKHLGYAVNYVQNVTDIDDRSIARGIQTGENWYDIVTGYYTSFRNSMQLLGWKPPDSEPYATHYIGKIIEMIEELIERGYAYPSKDGVYYRVSKFPQYGALSHRNIDELQSGARIEVDEFKDDPLDFALWKFVKPGEPLWESPWGPGRPGWHIECSAMARELLGEHFDIHGGGADLIFPHHENEIAQSTPLMAQAGTPMSEFWMHGGLLLFEGKKMSKSLGNFEPMSDVLQRHDPQAIRLLFLQTSYRKPMNFTEDSIGAATTVLNRIKQGYRELHALAHGQNSEAIAAGSLTESLEAALNEDMNTSVALSKVVAAASTPAVLLRAHGENAQNAFAELHRALDVLGLTPGEGWLTDGRASLPADFLERLSKEVGPEFSLNGDSAEAALQGIIALRTQVRLEKNWAESDRLRDILARCGVVLKDSKEGTTWNVGPG